MRDYDKNKKAYVRDKTKNLTNMLLESYVYAVKTRQTSSRFVMNTLGTHS